jgi:hypothetical protein
MRAAEIKSDVAAAAPPMMKEAGELLALPLMGGVLGYLEAKGRYPTDDWLK